MYKILEECTASVRHSVEGLDYYVAEGGRAFRDLEEVLEDFSSEIEEIKKMKEDLLDAKSYLKSDYKVHLREMSEIPDHCRAFSLSDTDSNFSTKCDHEHTESCSRCILLDGVLDSILAKVTNKEWDHKDQVLFKTEKAIDDIKEWKSHVLRSRNQEEARRMQLDAITNNDVLITLDWAMKFLPRKFREGQTDWFAKRGINWHISVSLQKGVADTYKTITHVHLFSSNVSQDSSVTSAIISDVVQDLVKTNPALTSAHLFSDNAGCYKSTSTIAALHNSLKGTIKSYNFSEAQDGKGPCDRRSSHLKSIIKRYINEGNDVVTAEHMKKAIDLGNKVNCRVKVVNPVIDLDHQNIKSIPGISGLHNFKFEDSGLQTWKAFGIGTGKFIPWTAIYNGELPSYELNVVQDWSYQPLVIFSADDTADDQEVVEPPKKKTKSENLFSCPKEGCYRSFRSNICLEQHILLGNCDYQLEKQTLIDRAKSSYSQKLDQLFPTPVSISSVTVTDESSNARIGWALKQKKKKTVFTTDQKLFMQEQFDIGKKTGRKVDPFEASKLMMSEIKSGKRRFCKSEFLSGSQIAGYFSRLSQKDRKMLKDDFLA